MAIGQDLYAPNDYFQLSKEEKEKICNGCGSSRAFIDFVPDSIWWCDISEACNIHDFMYHKGRHLQDRDRADRIFLNNMLRCIENNKSWFSFLNRLRRKTAMKYYQAVRIFGEPAFWKGKNA